MKISVIIPATSDREEYLELVLASLGEQTYPKRFWECIVVSDAASKGACRAVCKACGFQVAFVPVPKGNYDAGGRSRNAGARRAKHPHLVFLDSDVVLCPSGLTHYAEGFQNMPNRIMVGLYHWLPPMEVSVGDIRERFDDVVDATLPTSQALLDKPGHRKHNIGRDGRQRFFEATHPDDRRCNDWKEFLACLTGNIGMSKQLWEVVGGFREDLPGGVDGAFGMEAYRKGFTISWDSRIVGGHLYHERLEQPPEAAGLMHERLSELFHSDDTWLGRSV